jgi:lysophospholipase L1-like esterase
MGGDRTKCHLQEGEDIFSNGMMVNRHYDDDYLAEFIEIHEWNTFLITVAANDLTGGRPPAEVVDNIERLIDRYRSAWEIAHARNKALLEPKFLVVSPHTCGTIVNDEIYATYDELVGSLAGGDVAVCHLNSMLQEEYGSVDTWGEQFLIDTTHPSELGIRAMADMVWEEIELAWGGASDDTGPTHRVPGERASIAEAIQAAEPGDHILVAKGEYAESLSLGTPGILFYSVHGPDSAKIIPPIGERCAHIVGKGSSGSLPIIFEGFEFAQGSADHGGAVLIENASVEMLDCKINECSALLHGGAIAAQQSSLLLQSTLIINCDALGDGGGISIESSSLDAIDVLVKECTAGGSGGGAWAIDSVSNLTGSRFSRNRCSDRGGGFATVNGFILATNVLFDLNTAMGDNGGDGSGGGLHLAGVGNLDQVKFDSNFAVSTGGGMRIDTASETIELASVEFLANIAGTRGGGFSMGGGGSASMEYCALSDCVAGKWAAGIHVEDGHLDISLSLFETLEAPFCAAIDAEAGYVGVTSSVFCPAEMMLCGAVKDLGGNEYMESCVGICTGDMNGDGIINGSDLGLFFVAWGPCPVNTYCRADLNRDGVVNGGDLGLFLLEIESFPQYCQ